MTTKEADMKMRGTFMKAISEGLDDGLTTVDIVVTILELARIAAEGVVVATYKEHRTKIAQQLAATLTELAEHVRTFEVPAKYEALLTSTKTQEVYH